VEWLIAKAEELLLPAVCKINTQGSESRPTAGIPIVYQICKAASG
jgi:hypothetical protein